MAGTTSPHRQAKLAEARDVTFKDCAGRYIKSHAAGWRNPKHKAQWTATLEAYAYPVFGDLAVADVNTGLVLKDRRPIAPLPPHELYLETTNRCNL